MHSSGSLPPSSFESLSLLAVQPRTIQFSTLRSLGNPELLSSASRLASEERRITLSILEHFREIERRKAYSALGFSSLFDYAVKSLRYSEGSASRRIAAMYALRDEPELGGKIQSGETSVTAIAKIHTTIRREEKVSGKKWEKEAKKKLFSEMISLPMREIERNLIRIAPQAVLEERSRPVTSELHEVKIYLDSDDREGLESLRARLSHSMKNVGSNSELIKKLIRIAQESFRRKDLKAEEKPRRIVSPPRFLDQPQRGASPSRVPIAIRRAVFKKANTQREFILPAGRRCNAKLFLQVEHRIPRARGGNHEILNLEALCRPHNLIRGIQVFGPDKMGRV